MLTTEDAWMMAAVLAANIVLYFIPTFIIGRRMGLSGWWAFLWFLPWVAIWLLAIHGWPTLRERKSN